MALAGIEVDRFSLPGGGMQQHTSAVAMSGVSIPLTLGLEVDWPGKEDLGLWLDWIEFRIEASDLRARRPDRSSTLARRRHDGSPLLVFLGSGWRPLFAALAVAPASLLAAWVLGQDPWRVHRLLTGVPEALLLFGGALVAGTALARLQGAARGDLLLVSGAMLATFLLRGLALNSPGYYYPDLRSHARLALAIREAGWGFLTRPDATVAEVGLWQNPLGGRIVTFPYAPGFHLPLAASGLLFRRPADRREAPGGGRFDPSHRAAPRGRSSGRRLDPRSHAPRGGARVWPPPRGRLPARPFWTRLRPGARRPGCPAASNDSPN